jgi:predicted GIY-YIG superfamily endonuclease
MMAIAGLLSFCTVSIAREKEIKKLRREKDNLVVAVNAGWLDLSDGW